MAIALSLIALAIRMATGQALPGVPFLTFFPAIVITAYLGGFWSGVTTAVLSGLFSNLFILEPHRPLGWPTAMTVLGLYVFTCGVIITLIHRMIITQQNLAAKDLALRALNAELETRVAERTAALEAEVAERAEAEAQLRQMQKMESVGQLTGGIAHDFNNMLAVIIGSLDLARRRMTGDEPEHLVRGLTNALEAARRAANLTARLLAFSRQQPLAPRALDANTLVGGMSEMLRRTLGETVRIETVLAGGLWRAFADAAQLESAILNLAVNARDAMPSGGRLTIETANSDLDDRYARTHAEVTPGPYVMISVTDTGLGMPPDVIERAFDPFFTTKGVGKGTGLGLSQVFGFVKQSGGHVKIYSELGQGTTIKLYLPRHLGQAREREAATERADMLPRGARETVILVVEDEAQVRLMTVEALRELGYTVVHAADAAAALEHLSLQPRIDLLFTDIVMPNVSGSELADQARARSPALRVLFTTGYTRNAVVHNGMLDAGVAFLAKPFSLEALALKVRDVLEDRGANSV